MKMVVDASVLLMAYFPDEEYHIKAQRLLQDFALENMELFSPDFSRYEILNACLVAARRGRISLAKAIEISGEIMSTEIPGSQEVLTSSEILTVCEELRISAYDGVYVALARHLEIPFITADKKLFETIRSNFNEILWIGEY